MVLRISDLFLRTRVEGIGQCPLPLLAVIFDLAYPTIWSTDDGLVTLGIRVPKGVHPDIDRNQDIFRSIVIRSHSMIAPLKSCFFFLSRRFGENVDELKGIKDAIVSLLPVATGIYGREAVPQKVPNGFFSEVLFFLDQRLSDEKLSPTTTAKHFGISDRYLYKLFSVHGMSFCDYVREKRLARIASELSSSPYDRVPVADLALKWGFNDLSTFHRAFKKRYGCSPSRLRT